MNLTKTSLVAGVAGLLFMVSAYADPHFGRMAFSDSEDGDATDTFASDAPKIYMHIELLDWDKDAAVSGAWIAEKVEGAPPNYTIDTAEVVAKSGFKEATLSLSKPNKGWPVGSYRVEVSIDGKKVKTEHFTVE
jgi:hypothetical protein